MNKYIAALGLLLLCSSINAQRSIREISFNDFLQHVTANNLELVIEKYNVSVAEALLTASRVYADPELEMIFPTFDKEQFSGFPLNISFEMVIPVDIFGVRRNQIRKARSEKFASEATLDGFFRHLRSDAAAVYIDVLTNQLVISRMNLTLEQFDQLIDINQALFEAGEIGEIDLMQTRLEARKFQAEIFNARSEYYELMSEVYYLMGGILADSLVFFGDPVPDLSFNNFQELLDQTLTQRPDIIAAQRSVEANQYARQLARAERFPDVSLITGYHNEDATRPIAFSYSYAGLLLPFKFSGLNNGLSRKSFFEYEQSKVLLEAKLLDAESSLKGAWEKLRLLSEKKMLFTKSILQDAEKVRDASVYSYQRGEVSLLTVLDAQRTMNEIYMNYYETLAQYYNAIIELSRVSGQWLVEFN
jgi:cobalt-zinc-cadmium efflux system outer membrane protein